MGILSNTVSLSQYKLKGAPGADIDKWLRDCLYKNRFSPIDNLPDEESVGWVSLFDYNDSSFNFSPLRIDNYVALSLRKDKRSVPTALLRSRVDLECGKWLSENPDVKKMPSKRRMDIKENLAASLIAKMPPVPSVCDLVWNIKTSTVSIASTSPKILELLEDRFAITFEGVKLVPSHPMARAESVIEDKLKAALSHEDKASTKDALLQIKKNKWLGHDFLLWAMYTSSSSQGEFRITAQGPLEKGDVFVGYLHDSFLLAGDPEKGIRKSRIIGPQQDFGEARKALASGKNINEAAIYFEKADLSWSLNLKSDSFVFSSYKSPQVRREKAEVLDDPAAENEAFFLERMSLVESGIQLFESYLAAFLAERLTQSWKNRLKAIKSWMNED